MRRMLKLNIGLATVAGGLAGGCLALGYYIQSATFVILMLWFAFLPLSFKRGFQVGWLRGRHAMLNSMAEATRRRMSLLDWVEAEMERDGFVMVKETDDE